MPRRLSALYEKTIAFILGYIDDEALGAGAQLPTEPQLAAMAGVSLVTVRRALSELAAQSVVRREQGRGTFVARPRVRTEPTRIGNLRNGLLLDARSTLKTQLLGVGSRPATTDECDALGLAGDAAVWDVSRLRLLNDRPLIWERSAIPVLRAPDLDRHLHADSARSLYGILDAEFGLREGREEQQLLTRAATTQEHHLLVLRGPEWVVEITGVSLSVRQIPIDRFRMVFAGQSFSFRLSSAPLSALEAIERP
jgi:GntR family transcriptional regulator